MIIYVESKSFPNKTFVSLLSPGDKVARIRAQILHIINEIGRIDHQFRLRYKGQFLRDGFTISDYDITDKAVVHMVSMAAKDESFLDVQSVNSSDTGETSLGSGQAEDVLKALEKEIKLFQTRERFVLDFKTLLYLHSLGVVLSAFTLFWYSVFWIAPLFLLGALYSPNYTQVGGFVGSTVRMRQVFCIVYGVFGFLNLVAAVALSALTWIDIQSNGCPEWVLQGTCSVQTVFTAIFFTVLSLLLAISDTIVWYLLWNFKFEVGDLIEKYLVQERDVNKIMDAAKFGKLKEKRTAAYDLASMAASGDDNKFRIVAEGGLEVITAMALSQDEATQEHATEALAELLTIPAIQDTFVETGGMRTLSALLHSAHPRVMEEATMALYNIVSDSEENKAPLVTEHGLEDLGHAAYQGTLMCQRNVASIYLELAFNSEIREQIASRNIPAQALTHLCRSSDTETQRLSLQTLELLAIESPDLIYAQEELLEILVGLPLVTVDEGLYLLAGKILLYYGENSQTCEQMLDQENLKQCLKLFAKTKNPVLQKVVAKIIVCSVDEKHSKLRARELQLGEVLEYIKGIPADRECWDMADQGLELLNSDDETLVNLPSLTTLEKLNKMGDNSGQVGQFGSRTSLHSNQSGRSLSSTEGIKKGIN